MSDLNEEDICLLIHVLPSEARDFIFCTLSDAGDPTAEIIHPMEFLGLDLATSILELYEQQQPSLALVLSLCRLLVPCLEYRGNRRHLVVEEWSDSDLRGETLFEDTRTVMSRDLAVEQEGEYRVVMTGESPPENSLAEIFWEAHTELPNLPDVFEDPEMSNFARVLYHDLVAAGTGRQSIRVSEIRRRIMSLWSDNFQELDIWPPVRQRRRVFKRILAATIRLASQLNGVVARALIFRRLQVPRDQQTFTRNEEALLELRYGGSRALRDINLGLLFGCGPLFAELINDFAFAHAGGVPREQLDAASERLQSYIYLLGRFRERRKLARAEERRGTRLSRADRPPGERRESAAHQADEQAVEPSEQAGLNEDWAIVVAILPRLKPRDAQRLQALMDACGDRGQAAQSLGVDRETFNRRWRQTTFPNIRAKIEEVAGGEGFGSLLEDRSEDGEEENDY